MSNKFACHDTFAWVIVNLAHHDPKHEKGGGIGGGELSLHRHRISMGSGKFSTIRMGVFVLECELSDKEEPVTDMLMGANQAGPRCGTDQQLSLEEDLDCVTGRTEQTVLMCETDDLSHPDWAQMRSARPAPQKPPHE